jgi:hypothetical protein
VGVAFVAAAIAAVVSVVVAAEGFTTAGLVDASSADEGLDGDNVSPVRLRTVLLPVLSLPLLLLPLPSSARVETFLCCGRHCQFDTGPLPLSLPLLSVLIRHAGTEHRRPNPPSGMKSLIVQDKTKGSVNGFCWNSRG